MLLTSIFPDAKKVYDQQLVIVPGSTFEEHNKKIVNYKLALERAKCKLNCNILQYLFSVIIICAGLFHLHIDS